MLTSAAVRTWQHRNLTGPCPAPRGSVHSWCALHTLRPEMRGARPGGGERSGIRLSRSSRSCVTTKRLHDRAGNFSKSRTLRR